MKFWHKRKKTTCFLLSFLLLLTAFASCAPKEETGIYSFSDDTGVRVTLRHAPVRVAVLFSSLAEMWTLAGGEVAVSVGESVERGILSESVVLVDRGAGKQISDELLLASAPDLIIASADIAAQQATVSLAREAGIPAALFHVESFADYARVMGIFTDITQRADLYAKHVTELVFEIEQIKASVDPSVSPRILFVRCGSKYSATKAKSAKENFVCAMLEELGCYNIAEKAPLLLDGLSIEEILKENPDYIFFSTMGDEEKAKEYMDGVLKEPLWQSLDAVREGHYTYLPKELFQYKPNARWAEAYRYLNDLLHGEKIPS